MLGDVLFSHNGVSKYEDDLCPQQLEIRKLMDNVKKKVQNFMCLYYLIF